MATGQVSFKQPPTSSSQTVKKILVPTRQNPIINRLEKTRTVRSPDELPALQEEYLRGVRAEKRREAELRKKEDDRVKEERRREKEEKELAWEELRNGGGGGGGNNQDGGFDEDDFM